MKKTLMAALVAAAVVGACGGGGGTLARGRAAGDVASHRARSGTSVDGLISI